MAYLVPDIYMTGHPGVGQHMGPVQSCIPLPQGGARRAPGGNAPLQPRIHETSVKRLLGCEAVHPHSRLRAAPPAPAPARHALRTTEHANLIEKPGKPGDVGFCHWGVF